MPPALSPKPLTVVFRDHQVRIVSDVPVPAAQAKALAARIEDAYRYDTERQHWKDGAPLDKQITIEVLGKARWKKLTGDTDGSTSGYTSDADHFAVPATILDRRATADDDDTFAHELGHIQDYREAGKARRQIPIYLQEGKEYLLGDAYPLSRGRSNPAIRDVAKELSTIDGAVAREVMAHFRTDAQEAHSGDQGFRDEVTGALFVEFLRTRLGGGKPDAIARVAALTEAVGRGATYPAAFKAQFGVAPQAAEDLFVEFVKATEGNPKERLRGTLFEGASR
jgi:hypothetical protein